MKLFWLDFETTGLLPTDATILEVAIMEATLENPFQNPIPIFNAVRQFDRETTRHHNPMVVGGYEIDPFVLEMHTKNELWDECKKSTLSLEDIESHLLNLVPWVEDKEERPVLAGSTIHFDQGFMREHMPRLFKRFSHRLYDASAIKLFCRSLGMPKQPKAEAHRAEDDIWESMMHVKECVRWLREKFVETSLVHSNID